MINWSVLPILNNLKQFRSQLEKLMEKYKFMLNDQMNNYGMF